MPDSLTAVYSANGLKYKASDNTFKVFVDLSFRFRINTTYTSTGSTASNQFKLPTYTYGTYNCTVDWGDDTTSTITSYNQAEVTHTYETPGEYEIAIYGNKFWNVHFADTGDKLKILEIKNWGDLFRLGAAGAQFRGCANLTITAKDLIKNVTHFNSCFLSCRSLTGCTFFLNLNTSAITSTYSMFSGCSKFNQDLSTWDMSNVTNMSGMFNSCTLFNQNLNMWDISSVTAIDSMFRNCSAFNKPLDAWVFNVGLTSLNAMFQSATNFNQDITGWNVSNITNMGYMFDYASNFNQNISGWDVSKVTTMERMFCYAAKFKQNLGSWTPLALTNANTFLYGVDINNPNSATNQTNYDALLNGWAACDVKSNVSFHGGNSKYSAAGKVGRDYLTGTKGWTIVDGGQA